VRGDELIDDMADTFDDNPRYQDKNIRDRRDTHETVIVEHKYVDLDDPPRQRNSDIKKQINPVR